MVVEEMLFMTERFGEIEIDESEGFQFPEGLPGFPGEQRFALIKTGLEQSPFTWMQSLQDGELCFLLVDPGQAFQGYDVELNHEGLEMLKAEEAHILEAYAIVTVPDGDLRKATANLKAPLVLNLATRLAVQVIMDDDSCAIRQPLFAETGV